MLPFIAVEYAYVKEIAEVQIERFIAQLGNESYRERETSMQSLAMIGEPALERLRKAAASSQELEVRCRASQLIPPIEHGIVKRKVRELTASDLDITEKSKRLQEFIRPGMTMDYVFELLGFSSVCCSTNLGGTAVYPSGYAISFDRYDRVTSVLIPMVSEKPKASQESDAPQRMPSAK